LLIAFCDDSALHISVIK